jgi:AraC-like DNA-binding protein
MKTKNNLDISTHLAGRKLEDMVENRTVYSLEMAELNIYETHATATNVELTFSVPVLASMIHGKKVMHLEGTPAFDFYPGESVIVPGKSSMRIDFPEAAEQNPTQCLALSLSQERVLQLTDQLNERYPLIDSPQGWEFTPDNLYFTNDEAINQLLNRLIYVCAEGNAARDVFAGLILQELTIRLMQTKARRMLLTDATAFTNQNRLAFAVQYLREHLRDNLSVTTLAEKACMSEPHFYRCFKQQFGFSPVEFINRERIHQATQLLSTTGLNVTEIAFECGFNQANYFLKVFRRQLGVTPTQFRERQKARLTSQNALWATSDSWKNGAY